MRCHARGGLALLIAIVLTMAFVQSNAAAAEPSIEQKVKAIREEFRRQHRVAVEALGSAKTREEGLKLYHAKFPNPARCVERLLSLARTDPKSAGGFEALLAPVEFSDISWKWKDESVRPEEVVELLRENHIANPRLGETFEWLKDSHTQGARDLMREAARRSPSRETRGMAVFFLGADFDGHANLIEIFREIPGFQANLKQQLGKDPVANWAKADPKVLRDDAIRLLVQAQSEYGDVKVDDQPIGEQAEHMLFRLRRVQIGQTAPEIVGTDQNGQPMRLSDYRGKVVAIVFWGSWCGVCMRAVPGERELVEQMEL